MSCTASSKPPSILKALLDRRNGVPPGTTSTASHTVRRSTAFKGKWIRYELVRDCSLPNLNLTWLGLVFNLLLTSVGKWLCSNFNVFSPMMHRLAPVSKMAQVGPCAAELNMMDSVVVPSVLSSIIGGCIKISGGFFLKDRARLGWTNLGQTDLEPGTDGLILPRLLSFLFPKLSPILSPLWPRVLINRTIRSCSFWRSDALTCSRAMKQVSCKTGGNDE